MSISAILTGQNVYRSASVSHRTEEHMEKLAQSKKYDTIHISKKAKELSQEMQATKSKTDLEKSDKILPLEAYSLPKWLGGLFSKTLRSTSASYMKVGFSSQYIPRDDFYNDKPEEAKEYCEKLLTMFREELKKWDIKSDEDYYKNVILNKEKSEKIHQSLLKRLKEDERMSQLRDFLGIKA